MNDQRVQSVINTLIELKLIEYKDSLYFIKWDKLWKDYGERYDFRPKERIKADADRNFSNRKSWNKEFYPDLEVVD